MSWENFGYPDDTEDEWEDEDVCVQTGAHTHTQNSTNTNGLDLNGRTMLSLRMVSNCSSLFYSSNTQPEFSCSSVTHPRKPDCKATPLLGTFQNREN